MPLANGSEWVRWVRCMCSSGLRWNVGVEDIVLEFSIRVLFIAVIC